MIRAMLLLCLVSCVGTGQPLVMSIDADADGIVRTDLDTFYVAGRWEGSVEVWMKGSDFPVTVPVESKEGEWFFIDRKTGSKLTGKLGETAAPSIVRQLFRTGELEKVAKERFGLESGDQLIAPEVQ